MKKLKEVCETVMTLGDSTDYANFLLRVFGPDNDGCIDFEKYIVGLSQLLRGTVEDRIAWAFRFYDIHGMGFITYEEILTVTKAKQMMQGRMSSKLCTLHARNVFLLFKTNLDGRITKQDFHNHCIKDETILNLMLATSFAET